MHANRPGRAIVVAAASLVSTAAARAQQAVTPADSAALARLVVVPLRNGLTSVDLTGRPGDQGAVLVARRENISAHGYSAIAFSVRTRARTTGGAHWQLVTVDPESAGGRWRERQTLTTGEGADCTLYDVRLLRPHAGRGPATLVTAERDFGANFADTVAVHFVVYRLRHEGDDQRDYFARERTLLAGHRYCDVNAAFARELGLSDSAGVVHDVP